MFRTIGDRPSLRESRLPPEVLRLPEELARVDALLDDPAFFAPFAPYFHPVLGRPSTPAEWYLRLMFLKFRYRLGYESLCAEVSDSISWRRFCRIPLDGKVPHPTTLMKLTTRCGAGAVAGLNEALLAKAAGQKLLRTARVRADTTVIPADVAYPTDSGLLARAVGKMARTMRRVQAAGGASRTRARDRRRAAARRVREITSKLRARGKLAREENTRAIIRITGELADLAQTAAAEAAAVLRNGRRALPRALTGRMRGRRRRALDELAVTISRTAVIVAQTRSRLAGQLPDSATRLVSLHDPGARPIRKGRIDRPVEFGALLAVERLAGQRVAAFLEVAHALDVAPVGLLGGQRADVQRLGDPPVHRDGLPERGRVPVALQHADHVVGADLAGVDRDDNAEDVAPVRADPAQVDPSAGEGAERPVVG